MMDAPKGLAKITWTNPEDGRRMEYVLSEGATVIIGRSRGNEVCIPEQHVSRQHSVISHQYGVFMISDLGSANGTFVNDQQITDPFPLADGDVIRLYVPEIRFSAAVTLEEEAKAIETGTMIVAADKKSRPRLMITSGEQEGLEIPIFTDMIEIGRATANATWHISLQDRAVSRPHARIEKKGDKWYLTDLRSANGTQINGKLITEPEELVDGSVMTLGQTTLIFRLGGK